MWHRVARSDTPARSLGAHRPGHPAEPEHVVLLSGVWLPRGSLWPLARHLRRAGYTTHLFSYRTVGRDLQQNAAALQAFVSGLPAGHRHFVAFSLGGLVVRALFHFHPQQPPGRIVTLGTPHGGSLAARRLVRGWWGRALAGKSLMDLVAGRPQSWPPPSRDIGVIAGTVNIGLGRLLVRWHEPSDGAVAVNETWLPQATDRLSVRTNHFGLLLSAAAARAACRFLRHGRFAG